MKIGTYAGELRAEVAPMRAMLRLFSLVALAGVASGAAQGNDLNACFSKPSSGDDLVAACRRLIQSRQLHGRDLAGAYFRLGDGHAGLGRYDSAIAAYSQAIRQEPRLSVIYQNRGVAWAEKRNFDRAIADFDDAIRLNPNESHSFVSRSHAYRSKSEHDRALADAEEAVRLAPQSATAFVARAWARGDKRQFDGMLADASEAIRLDPMLATGWRIRAVAHEVRGEFDTALTDLRMTLKLEPHNHEAAAAAKRIRQRLSSNSSSPQR